MLETQTDLKTWIGGFEIKITKLPTKLTRSQRLKTYI